MPSIRSVEVYGFSELSESAKDRVRSWYAEHGMTYEWWDSVYEDWDQDLKEVGITLDDTGKKYRKPAIHFSGFYSQGDGACFEGAIYNSDMAKFMEAHGMQSYYPLTYKLAKLGGVFMRVKHSGHYSHEYCTRFEFEFSSFWDHLGDEGVMEGVAGVYDDQLNGEVTSFEEHVVKICRDYMKKIYRSLEREYGGLLTDEAIADTCEANDWVFTSDGRFFH